MSSWRMAGLNYVNYSNIAAKVLRQSLKREEMEEAVKRGEASIRCTYWLNGEALATGQKPTWDKDKPP